MITQAGQFTYFHKYDHSGPSEQLSKLYNTNTTNTEVMIATFNSVYAAALPTVFNYGILVKSSVQLTTDTKMRIGMYAAGSVYHASADIQNDAHRVLNIDVTTTMPSKRLTHITSKDYKYYYCFVSSFEHDFKTDKSLISFIPPILYFANADIANKVYLESTFVYIKQ